MSLLPWGVFRLILRRSISTGGAFPYGRGVPQLAQNLPLFTVPQAQVHSSEAGLGWPHSAQNLPVFTAPQAHFHSPAGAGLGWPHSAQNLPVFPA